MSSVTQAVAPVFRTTSHYQRTLTLMGFEKNGAAMVVLCNSVGQFGEGTDTLFWRRDKCTRMSNAQPNSQPKPRTCAEAMSHIKKFHINEEDPSSTPSIPESVVKIATMEIDLEAPIALEPETDDTHEDIIKAVVEAIISISSFEER
ncbi:hypothetical protein Tco_1394985 [Tanacetum coccineum]